jgi:predicted nucleic acid-binding Zn ribbon protein
MSDPAPESCEVCGASPVELVLYPVAIHYKGSGFYSTDYGKRAKKKAEAGSTDGGGGSGGDSGGGEKKSSDTGTGEKKKAAEA